MKDRYLEITYRKGKAIAAYLYLTGKPGTKIVKVKKLENGLIADFDGQNRLIGLEITSPKTTTIKQINQALITLSIMPVSENELAPLKAA